MDRYNHFDYCEMLAARLSAIGHGGEYDRFYRATEQTELEELEANIASASGTILIAIDGANSEFSFGSSDNLNETPSFSIVIAKQTSASDTATILQAQKECKEIAFQCVSKLLQDAKSYKNGCEFLNGSSFLLNGFGPIADLFYGVILTYSFDRSVNYMLDKSMWKTTDSWDNTRN